MKLTSKDIKWKGGMNWAFVNGHDNYVFEQYKNRPVDAYKNYCYIVEREEKKTVVDAVNCFKGEFPDQEWEQHRANKHSINICTNSNEDGQQYNKGEMYAGGTDCCNGYFITVCTKKEFNQCVKEMSLHTGYEPFSWYESYYGERKLTKENSNYSYYDTLESIKELDETQERINGLNYIIKQLHEALELKQIAIELLKSANKDTQELEDEWQNGDCVYDNISGSLIGRYIGKDIEDHVIFLHSIEDYDVCSSSFLAKKPKKEDKLQKQVETVMKFADDVANSARYAIGGNQLLFKEMQEAGLLADVGE